jgi:hypothetical protein
MEFNMKYTPENRASAVKRGALHTYTHTQIIPTGAIYTPWIKTGGEK